MAVLQRMAHYQQQQQIRQPNNPNINKESEWSGLCDNVFDQFVNDDDVFGLNNLHQRQSSSSDNSAHLFDYSVSPGQSNHTSGTSPDPAWVEQVALTAAAVESLPPMTFHAQQPQAKESVGFWQKTLKALERNAAESEEKQRKLRATRSHPDFLSLGGHPSPAPCVPYPVPDHSLSVPRSRPSREAANGAKKRSTSQIRSVSRGRPQGITKTNSSMNVNQQNATVRKRSISPVKMMTPSRYRAGFRDVWADQLQQSPPKYALRVPTHSLPESPPASGQLSQHDFAAFSSPTNPHPALLAAYDSELSPLATTFQQARIHTPDASPFFVGAVGQVQLPYIDHNGAFQSGAYTTTTNATSHTIPLNDTTTSFADRTIPSAEPRISSFDFGFPQQTADAGWSSAGFDQPSMTDYHAAHVPTQDVFVDVEQHSLALDQSAVAYATGLGISCDSAVYFPTTNTTTTTTGAHEYHLPANVYQNMQTMQQNNRACYAPMPQAEGPITPQKQRGQAMQSRSPSPPLTEPRSRRLSGVSGLRRASKHRRAKSTTAVPRHAQSADKGGFVNFTPDDSNKILSGVAPSGSSKTKARREKEAADKRRRLSQAAVRAVVEAGGDLESLAKAGLIV